MGVAGSELVMVIKVMLVVATTAMEERGKKRKPVFQSYLSTYWDYTVYVIYTECIPKSVWTPEHYSQMESPFKVMGINMML